MRSLIRLFIFLFLIALLVSWFFLPENITVSNTLNLAAPPARAFTFLENENEWKKWWPQRSDTLPPFEYNDRQYKLGRHSDNIAEILISKDDQQFAGNLMITGSSTDTAIAQWTTPVYSGKNIFKRLRYYLVARSLKEDMQDVLTSYAAFLSKPENIYGMQILRERVKDTVLVATRAIYDHYPTTTEVYAMVQKLKTYIAAQNASETNAPMLHVVKSEGKYQTMVGIPTDRALANSGDIELKRMVPGYILHGTVTGGVEAVQKGFQNMEFYRYDKRLASPAIPFSLLVTDRTKEPDSNKWVTGLYYPVF
jgi:hypothetical protein